MGQVAKRDGRKRDDNKERERERESERVCVFKRCPHKAGLVCQLSHDLTVIFYISEK